MADCHNLFQQYHNTVKLSVSKKEFLKKGKNAIRNRIKNYFINTLKIKSPKFWSQGSYALRTIVNPIDGEYDIDDGVYLQNIEEENNWPSPQTVHKWIYSAVKGHTREDPIDKRTCIRVVYSGEYHIDLPIYAISDNNYYLAEKSNSGWHISNPKKFHDWFMTQLKINSEQLRTIVKYLKAWADYQRKYNRSILPSGLILTVLTTENCENRERDDAAFGRTVKNIYQKICNEFEVCNPVDEYEILTERLTDKQRNNFVELIFKLMNSANEALGCENKKEACEIWRREFGDRFPSCDNIHESEEEVLYTKSPAILKDDARSAY